MESTTSQQMEENKVDMNELLVSFWNNHTQNEKLINELQKYCAIQNYLGKKRNRDNEEDAQPKEDVVVKNVIGNLLRQKVKDEPIPMDYSHGCRELTSDFQIDGASKQTKTQAFNSVYSVPAVSFGQNSAKPTDLIKSFLQRIPVSLKSKIKEARIKQVLQLIKNKWSTRDFPYSEEIAFDIFEKKDFQSAQAYRLVESKTFLKYLKDNYSHYNK